MFKLTNTLVATVAVLVAVRALRRPMAFAATAPAYVVRLRAFRLAAGTAFLLRTLLHEQRGLAAGLLLEPAVRFLQQRRRDTLGGLANLYHGQSAEKLVKEGTD